MIFNLDSDLSLCPFLVLGCFPNFLPPQHSVSFIFPFLLSIHPSFFLSFFPLFSKANISNVGTASSRADGVRGLRAAAGGCGVRGWWATAGPGAFPSGGVCLRDISYRLSAGIAVKARASGYVGA